ncbi:hypothetical protein [Polyangium jinanense]|uniref:Uncharacterized protein n=1 Tax=Polyangium jinanense TaxID=2829994 RepID=A0A9X3XC46_9BACT|nr:hypothetical protein [Polyangium jinanense]MDC3959827.1 hypothetical protein [Polyangium jinanense]MDC3986278.1 hypothetical protein [Polyangium jinanense]
MAALWGIPGADPRRTLLAVLVQGEVTAAALGDVEAAAVAHDAAERLLALLSDADESMAAARAAHDAVGKVLHAIQRR